MSTTPKKPAKPAPAPAQSAAKKGEKYANADGDEVTIVSDQAGDVVSYRNSKGMPFTAPASIFFGGMTKRS